MIHIYVCVCTYINKNSLEQQILSLSLSKQYICEIQEVCDLLWSIVSDSKRATPFSSNRKDRRLLLFEVGFLSFMYTFGNLIYAQWREFFGSFKMTSLHCWFWKLDIKCVMKTVMLLNLLKDVSCCFMSLLSSVSSLLDSELFFSVLLCHLNKKENQINILFLYFGICDHFSSSRNC